MARADQMTRRCAQLQGYKRPRTVGGKKQTFSYSGTRNTTERTGLSLPLSVSRNDIRMDKKNGESSKPGHSEAKTIRVVIPGERILYPRSAHGIPRPESAPGTVSSSSSSSAGIQKIVFVTLDRGSQTEGMKSSAEGTQTRTTPPRPSSLGEIVVKVHKATQTIPVTILDSPPISLAPGPSGFGIRKRAEDERNIPGPSGSAKKKKIVNKWLEDSGDEEIKVLKHIRTVDLTKSDDEDADDEEEHDGYDPNCPDCVRQKEERKRRNK